MNTQMLSECGTTSRQRAETHLSDILWTFFRMGYLYFLLNLNMSLPALLFVDIVNVAVIGCNMYSWQN